MFTVHVGDRHGQEPIHEAASANCLDILKLLHKKGARLTATDKKGQTPVHKVDQKRLSFFIVVIMLFSGFPEWKLEVSSLVVGGRHQS